MDKPNILFIMSDEHNASVLGCMGDDIVKTPNIDNLADNGIVFENCYTPSPICIPARLSITAGKYISKCGAWNNESMLESDNITSIASLLKGAGYDCYLGGKMHYSKNRRYGFEELYPYWTNTNERKLYKKRINLQDGDFIGKEPHISKRFDEFYVGENNRVIEHDKKVTQTCSMLIENRKLEDRPFFLIAGYLAPHFPLIVPEEYYKQYKDKVPMPNIPKGYAENLPIHYQVMRKAFGTEGVPDDMVKKGRELYYGLVTWFDKEVGKLLSTLEDSKVRDNTIVIYTSDHGENMGEHGLWWKNSMYDSSSKVPLIISWPKKWAGGQRRTQVCSLLDVIKTITDIAGVDNVPSDWDGKSMMKVIEDNNSSWHDYAVSEYYAHNVASGHCMIRQGKYKYVYFNRIDEEYGPDRQLFNLEEDPNELNNIINDNKDIAKQLHMQLVKELGKDPEDIEKEIRQITQSQYL